jgi:hypothetical protein
MAKDLNGAYEEIYAKFQAVHNGKAANYKDLVAAMHPNVIVKRVRVADVLFGAAAVEKYLDQSMYGRHCHFENVKKTIWMKKNGLYGTVSGHGDYFDDDNEVNPTPVTFTWCFSRATANDHWVLVNVFGAPVGS